MNNYDFSWFGIPLNVFDLWNSFNFPERLFLIFCGFLCIILFIVGSIIVGIEKKQTKISTRCRCWKGEE